MIQGKVYKLVSNIEGNNEVYVGSTRGTLRLRKSKHKDASKRNPLRRVYQYFKANEWDTVDIVLLENVECVDLDELRASERYWVDLIGTLNKVKPTQTTAEWKKTHKKRVYEQNSEYRQRNLAQINTRRALNYQANMKQINEKRRLNYQANRKQINEKRRLKYQQAKETIKTQQNLPQSSCIPIP